jgi:hypothetical protein
LKNPYEPTHPTSETYVPIASIVEARRITFWPGLAMVIHGLVILLVFVVAISVEICKRGIARVFADETSLLVAIVAILSLMLIRCGLGMIRLSSLRLSHAGVLLSMFLFMPVGVFICYWAMVALSKPIVREAFRKVSN